MSLHKLTAGSGYDYLTRQVAAMDSTEKGYTGLASYYTERGETPGVWVGSGCDAIRPGFTGMLLWMSSQVMTRLRPFLEGHCLSALVGVNVVYARCAARAPH